SLVMMASCSGRAARAGRYDVVVIGGGAAGLAASIEAAEAGASVALLEKMPMVGGSTVLSGGIVYATGSRLQEGVEDSVEDLVAYWSDRADGKNNPDFLHFVADHSGETIDWLLDMGVELEGPGVSGTSPVLRALTSTTHGAGIINPMKAKAESLGVEIHTRTAATGLVNKDGKISGVLAEDRDGKALRFDAGAVVLASGGFDRNPELMQELAPVALGQKTFAGSGNNGDGLLMAREQGADVVSHGGVIGFRAVEGEPAYTSDICMLMWFPYMYVNLGGERFINELTDYPLFYEELIRQEDQTAYMIFDGNSYVETLDRAVEKGSAFRASTLEELAALTGIDAAGLESTVVVYTSMIDAGVDSDFGKPLAGLPRVDNPDYYALKIIPAILGTLSGVKVDLDTQVLDGSDSPIPGLYAAGEVANGSFYNTVYPASGTSIQMSLTFGRVAGAGAAAFAK
ncbi:MAG: FAD-dependent oxidoreductase, partial [Spirochaetales bacterium]|nr:FAD-dependent oxidoreductase [Spirochaetales bacterium]